MHPPLAGLTSRTRRLLRKNFGFEVVHKRPDFVRREVIEPEFGFIEAEILFDLDADDRKDCPDREAHRECQRADPNGAVLIAGGDSA